MYTNPEVTRSWKVRHPQFMNPRDAEISFDCDRPDFILVSEVISGKVVRSQTMLQNPDVVTALETMYIFFADEADRARKLVGAGRSCVYHAYCREP
jgi:hypothetical protein